jgi:chromosome partitioning protein
MNRSPVEAPADGLATYAGKALSWAVDELQPANQMGLIYAVANQKGGVGKTTTTVNLAAALASQGQKTLVVDLDQQCNATVGLGLDRTVRPSTYEVLAGEVTLFEAARPAGPENLWIVPASRDLAGAVVELPRLENSNYRLKEQLGPLREQFDAVLMDCPPALGPVTVNALVAADRVIVPVQAEYLALEGLAEFRETMATVQRELNPDLQLAGMVVTMHDERTRLAQDVERDLREHFQNDVFRNVIPRTVRLAEAPSYGIPITDYAPQSRGAGAYVALANEVQSRG